MGEPRLTEPPGAIVQEIEIAARPETVFPFLIDPDRMCQWMGATATLDPRPGGVWSVDINEKYRARGAFVHVEPPTRVVFTWGWEDTPTVPPGSSQVEITLTPRGTGTLLRLVHSGLVADTHADHTKGWTHYLARLATVAAGGDPGPDPNAAMAST
ncbi:MAG: SRPBCC domain-containing protein [Chloroflexota bacterium]|nr:MAG: SRPBCC domain-containing protein [Chloroflexota bacterium]